MPSIDVYNTTQVDAVFEGILPSTSGASAGMTLKLNANLQPYWG